MPKDITASNQAHLKFIEKQKAPAVSANTTTGASAAADVSSIQAGQKDARGAVAFTTANGAPAATTTASTGVSQDLKHQIGSLLIDRSDFDINARVKQLKAIAEANGLSQHEMRGIIKEQLSQRADAAYFNGITTTKEANHLIDFHKALCKDSNFGTALAGAGNASFIHGLKDRRDQLKSAPAAYQTATSSTGSAAVNVVQAPPAAPAVSVPSATATVTAQPAPAAPVHHSKPVQDAEKALAKAQQKAAEEAREAREAQLKAEAAAKALAEAQAREAAEAREKAARELAARQAQEQAKAEIERRTALANAAQKALEAKIGGIMFGQMSKEDKLAELRVIQARGPGNGKPYSDHDMRVMIGNVLHGEAGSAELAKLGNNKEALLHQQALQKDIEKNYNFGTGLRPVGLGMTQNNSFQNEVNHRLHSIETAEHQAAKEAKKQQEIMAKCAQAEHISKLKAEVRDTLSDSGLSTGQKLRVLKGLSEQIGRTEMASCIDEYYKANGQRNLKELSTTNSAAVREQLYLYENLNHQFGTPTHVLLYSEYPRGLRDLYARLWNRERLGGGAATANSHAAASRPVYITADQASVLDTMRSTKTVVTPPAAKPVATPAPARVTAAPAPAKAAVTEAPKTDTTTTTNLVDQSKTAAPAMTVKQARDHFYSVMLDSKITDIKIYETNVMAAKQQALDAGVKYDDLRMLASQAVSTLHSGWYNIAHTQPFVGLSFGSQYKRQQQHEQQRLANLKRQEAAFLKKQFNVNPITYN